MTRINARTSMRREEVRGWCYMTAKALVYNRSYSVICKAIHLPGGGDGGGGGGGVLAAVVGRCSYDHFAVAFFDP